MKIYLAPLEGLTDYTLRNPFEEVYGQGKVDKYFTPFISPNSSERFLTKEMRDIDRLNNTNKNVIPQVMTNSSKDFIWTIKKLYEEFGYKEINLNAGCPSGTVVSKGKGSGFLGDLDNMEKFFYETFSDSFILDNDIKISVKTRIGLNDSEHWPDILEIYNKFKLEELIVHPRIRSDFYKNDVNLEAFNLALKESTNKIVYNGDIFTRTDFLEFKERFPECDAIMLGRGLIADPALIDVLKAKDPVEFKRDLEYDKERLAKFHKRVLEERLKIMSGDKHAIHRMKEMWCYMEYVLDDKKDVKLVKKSQKMEEYKLAVKVLLNNTNIEEKEHISFWKKH